MEKGNVDTEVYLMRKENHYFRTVEKIGKKIH